MRGQGKHTGRVWRHFLKEVRPAGIDFYLRELVIVEAGPAHFCIVQRKTQWFDQVQLCACIGAQTDDVAGIRR